MINIVNKNMVVGYRQKVRFIMIVRMYDAEEGVTKEVKNVVRVAMYNGELKIKDNQEVEFFIPPDELEHYCIYVADDIQCVDDWGE